MAIPEKYKPPISFERVRGNWIGQLIAAIAAAWKIAWALVDSEPIPKLASVILALVYGFLAYWFWRAIDYTGWRVLSRCLPRRLGCPAA